MAKERSVERVMSHPTSAYDPQQETSKTLDSNFAGLAQHHLLRRDMTTPQQPGWYDDPNAPNAQRYWDGQDWTPHRRRNPTAAPASPPTQPQQQAPPPPPPPNLPPPSPPSNLPPVAPPAHPLPPPPAQEQPPAAPRGKFGVSKAALVLAGLALLLAIAAVVAGRVELGTFLPGILVVVAIAAIAAFFTLRSNRSVARKAMLVTATVLVVAVAIPASLKVFYPAYNRFFGQKSAESSSAGTASPGSGPEGSGPGAGPGSGPGGSPDGGAKQAPSPNVVKSGILVETHPAYSDKTIYGFLDPSSGKYAEVASFNIAKYAGDSTIKGDVGVSPDFTKLAVVGRSDGKSDNSAGWIDTSGNYTSVSPKVDPGAFGGNPPTFKSVGFDGTGNFYYIKWDSKGMEAYKLAAGSTTNAQKISSELPNLGGALDYDGSMHLGCSAVNWLGPNSSVTANGTQITTQAITGRNQQGCPDSAYGTMPKSLLPKDNTATVTNAVGNHDGTKIAFKYYGRDSGGTSQQDNANLYIVAADGSGQPTKVNLSGLSGEDLHKMTFLKWI
jgi:hypothetical protein